MFKRYRILELGGRFIPQFKASFFDSWSSIDGGLMWHIVEYQIKYCSKPTIEEARAEITKYINKNKQQIHKY